MVGAVHMGIVQGTVTHAVYRLRPVPTAVRLRCLANYRQHVDRRHFLCAVRRTVHLTDTVFRHFQAHVCREGTAS